MSINLNVRHPRPGFVTEIVAWARQMRAALHQPRMHDVPRHIDIARAVDRGVSHIRMMGQDPRL